MTDPNATIGAKARTTLLDIIDLAQAVYREWLQPLAEFCWHSAADAIYLNTRPGSVAKLRRSAHDMLMKVERRVESCLPARLHRARPFKTVLLLLLLLVALLLLPGDSSIDELKAGGELVVISRESPTTLYREENGHAGPEYDYLASFAEFLGVELRVDTRENRAEVLAAMRNREGHLAAGMTYYPPLEEEGFVFGPPYQEVEVHVVCRRRHGRIPKNGAELATKELVVVADTHYESHLFDLQNEYPDLTWESDEEATVDDLLESVWRREIDCTIANSSELNIKRRFFPELKIAFTLEENQHLAWTLSPEWEALSDAIDQWLEVIENDGTLLILRDRHHKIEDFDYVDMRTFIRRIRSRLPKLEPIFRRAAEKHKIPWTLLAATAYQESHWSRRAKSPTGVRGIMMLTLTTANEVGVSNRLDPEQSIMGGAKYLRRLERRIGSKVTGDDRWWFALAAYNMGMGHLHDARELAERLGLDSNSWLDLRGVLPLLTQKKYYRHLKRGFARGNEAATYVRQIRNYQNILLAQIARDRGIHAE